jgi:GNAT superfamily N-acetyltransferase
MREPPAGIELRRAGADDQPRVIALVLAGIQSYREWAPDWTPAPPSPEHRERFRELYDDDERAWVLMALAGDDVVGVVSLSVMTGADSREPDPGTVYLWQMFVGPDWQGSTLAGALMDRVLGEARRRGYTRMVLWAAAGAAQARRFYEREGWSPTGEADDESNFGLPLVQYARTL